MKKYALILLFFLSGIVVFAQRQQFEVGLVGGLNFSALEGENLTDYYGLNVGLLSTAQLSEKYQLGMELLFSQNAEYLIPTFYPKVEYSQLRLNHLEIPIYLSRLVTTNRNGRLQRATFNVGITYAYLISHQARNTNQRDITNQIIYDKRNAILPQAGAIFHFSQKMGFNLKATIPVGVEDWTVAVRLVYML